MNLFHINNLLNLNTSPIHTNQPKKHYLSYYIAKVSAIFKSWIIAIKNIKSKS